MSTLTIKEMLKSGKTPEELVREINSAKRELDKEAEQEKKKKEAAAAREKQVQIARQKVVDAMKEYSKVLYGVEPDIKLMDSFNSDLKEIEAGARFVSDDDKIKKFLRSMMLEW